MLKNLFSKISGDPNEKAVARLRPIVAEINALEDEFRHLSADDLLAVTDEFRQQMAEALAEPREAIESAEAELENEEDADRRRQLEQEIKKLETDLFKVEDEELDQILPRAFAAVRESAQRTIGQRHFDVQLIGGTVLHQGKIAEMKTGEGKTLVATLPLYLHALSGRGCHLITVNDYLARRDGGWMGAIFQQLGLKVGLITGDFSGLYDPDYVDPQGHLEDERLVHWRPSTRQEAYLGDITYGTSSEFGFDYLRDNLSAELSHCVQREFYYAIVDEVDNILIDESRTPLIISGPAEEAADDYTRFAELVRLLRRNTAAEEAEPNGDFNIEERTRAITLTERGIVRVEAELLKQGVLREGESVYDPQYYALTSYLDNALRAQHVYRRDKEYVVMEGRVVIVDERTGRLMPDRRYSEGLHQAIEAKEHVHVRREDVTLATVTLQNFFRNYRKLSGMTGTAATESEELYRIYGLEVVVIPTNVEDIVGRADSGLRMARQSVDGAEQITYQDASSKPVYFKRLDYTDQVFKTEEAKYRAVVKMIKELHRQKCPILVGTTSVENSEKLGKLLEQEKIRHEVLNAKQHQREASIVAQAGRPGAVTLSTSMAGRGTDILLGGYPEGLAVEKLTELLFDQRSLENLARRALEDANAARQFAQRDSHLSPALVDWILNTQVDYEKVAADPDVMKTGDLTGLTSYLVRALQGDPHQLDYDTALAVVRNVGDGRSEEARKLVEERGYSIEVTALVAHWLNDYRQHPLIRKALGMPSQPEADDMTKFLSQRLFQQHYNARAALIRSVLKGNLDRARQIVAETPGLSAKLIDTIQAIKDQCERDRQLVRQVGGLHIVGTERHEARRIDNQLRGRAARQGDPGSSAFFLSFEDELMRRFGGDTTGRLMTRLGLDEDMPLEHRMVDRAIAGAQERVESYYFDMRKNLVEYDDVVNRQRESVYSERQEILKGSRGNLEARIRTFFAEEIKHLLDRYLDGFLPWMQSQINEAMQEYSNLETGRVNVNGLFARLHGILPQIEMLDRQALKEQDADRVAETLKQVAEEAQANDHHIALLAREAGAMIPIWPALPNLSAVRNYAQRQQVQQDFVNRARSIFDSLTIGWSEAQRQQRWSQTEKAIVEAFGSFAVENISVQERQKQQGAVLLSLTITVGDAIRAVLAALDRDQTEAALLERTRYALEEWRRQQIEEEWRRLPAEEQQSLGYEFERKAEYEVKQRIRSKIEPEVSGASAGERTAEIESVIEPRVEQEFKRDPAESEQQVKQLVQQELQRKFEPAVNEDLRTYEQWLVLSTIDHEWRQYLEAIDDLRQGIGLEAFGQRDPKIEFKRRALDMFEVLRENVQRTIVTNFFSQMASHRQFIQAKRERAELQERAAQANYRVKQQRRGGVTLRRDVQKVNRNDPCPCGSGKKYKNCHGAPGAQPLSAGPAAGVPTGAQAKQRK